MKIEWNGDETGWVNVHKRGIDFEDNPFHTEGLVELSWLEFMHQVLNAEDLKVLETEGIGEKKKIVMGIFYG